MPGNFRNDDLRVDKTLNAIQKAFLALLESRTFGQITVNKLCEEAQISRRTFYLHYNDKYDLLKTYLTNIGTKSRLSVDDCIRFVRENDKIISNIVKDGDEETLDLLSAFMFSPLDVDEKKDEDGTLSPWYIVLSNFCKGGMIKLLSWQVVNKFQPDLQKIINTQYISLITHIMTWEYGQIYNDAGGKLPNDEP